MSLRIGPAYRLPKLDANQIAEKFAAFRADARVAARLRVAAEVLQTAVDLHDARTYALTSGKAPVLPSRFESPLQEAADEAADNRADISRGFRRPKFDFGLEATFIDGPDCTYVILYVEQREIFERFVKFFPGERFDYQDATDGPKDVSKEDWDARGVAWEAVLRPHGWIPSRAGTTYALFDGAESAWCFEKPSDFDGVQFPDIETRVARLAMRHAEARLWQERCEAAAARSDGLPSLSDILSVIGDVAKNPDLSAEERRLVREVLDPTLAFDALERWPESPASLSLSP